MTNEIEGLIDNLLKAVANDKNARFFSDNRQNVAESEQDVAAAKQALAGAIEEYGQSLYEQGYRAAITERLK